MGLGSKFKKYSGISAASSVAARGVTAAKSAPRAAQVFGQTLAREVKKEARTPGSEGQRFLRAPLGQYYLPGKVQRVAKAIVPTPERVISTYSRGYREGGLKNFGRMSVVGAEVGTLGTLPAAGRGLYAAGKAGVGVASRVAARGVGARVSAGGARVAAGEFGGVRAAGKAGARAAQRKVAQEVGADIAAAKPKAFTITRETGGGVSINKVPFADIVSGKTKVPGLTKGVVTSEGFTNAFAQVNRGKVASLTFRAEQSASTPIASATKGTIKATQAAPTITKPATVPKPVSTTPKVAPKPKMPSAEESAAAKIEPRKVGRTPKSAGRSGPVKTRKMTAEELANFDNSAVRVQQEIAAGQRTITGAPLTTKTVIRPKPAATGGTKAPKPRIPTKTAAPVPTAPKPKPAAPTSTGGQQTPREAIREIMGRGKAPRGSYSALARKYGISRQRVSELVKIETKAQGAVPAVEQSPAAKVAAKAVRRAAPRPKVTAPKPANTTPAAAPAKAPSAPQASTAPTQSAPAVEAVKVRVARPAANPTGASTGLAARVTAAAYKHVPKKTIAIGAAAAGAGVMLSNRDKVGVGGKKGDTPATVQEDRAWVENLPEGLRADIKALFEVKDKKGEAGLRALVEGLNAAKRDESYISPEELRSPETSRRFSPEYKALKTQRGTTRFFQGGRQYDPNQYPNEAVVIENEAKVVLLKRVRERQEKLLRQRVGEAYTRIQSVSKTERERSKNR